MPGRDRTGPSGMGAMTGRGAGLCAGNSSAGFSNQGYGRGGNGIRGGGRGWKSGFGLLGFGGGRRNAFQGYGVVPNVNSTSEANMTKEQQVENLKGQAEQLADALEDVKQSIARLDQE
jgi:Family of unknown function (DUF5320)